MKRLLKTWIAGLLLVVAIAAPVQQAQAFGLYEIIKAAVVKAIKAADLAIQRQQNRIVWLQNAQKVLENTLSKLRLDEISDWTERQRTQYQKYFDELRKIKTIIVYYQRIKEISQTQLKLAEEYGRIWRIIKDDKHFTPEEILHMGEVYTGILHGTVNNIDQLSIVISSFKTQMSDAQRLEFINQIADAVDENFAALKRFNAENGMLRLQRARSDGEIELIKKLYGLN